MAIFSPSLPQPFLHQKDFPKDISDRFILVIVLAQPLAKLRWRLAPVAFGLTYRGPGAIAFWKGYQGSVGRPELRVIGSESSPFLTRPIFASYRGAGFTLIPVANVSVLLSPVGDRQQGIFFGWSVRSRRDRVHGKSPRA